MSDIDEADRRALRDALRSALEPPNGRPSIRTDPEDRGPWLRLAEQLGLAGISLPAELGGSGLGLAEELIAHEELGRVLSGLPFLPTVGLAATALREVDGAGTDLLAAIAEGRLTMAAILGADGDAPVLHAAAPTRPAGGGAVVISGVAECVIGGAHADALLVRANAAGDDVLAWLPADVTGVRREPLTAIDLTRGYARVTFDSAPATVLACGAEATRAAAFTLRNGYLALAAESVGLATRALEMTVEYAKVRHQFGRPIGSFQAVKHRCAEMLVQLETARSALVFGRHAAESGDPSDSAAALAVTRMYCGQIPFWIAGETIHLHGGIGFTWEHPAHLFYRRAKANQILLDPHERQRRLLATLVADRYEREEAIQ